MERVNFEIFSPASSSSPSFFLVSSVFVLYWIERDFLLSRYERCDSMQSNAKWGRNDVRILRLTRSSLKACESIKIGGMSLREREFYSHLGLVEM
jgi:hypothetical protein